MNTLIMLGFCAYGVATVFAVYSFVAMEKYNRDGGWQLVIATVFWFVGTGLGLAGF